MILAVKEEIEIKTINRMPALYRDVERALDKPIVFVLILLLPLPLPSNANANANCLPTNAISATSRTACDVQNETNKCAAFFKKYPESSKFMRSCEKEEDAPEWTSVCPQAVLDAWTQIWRGANHLQMAEAACDQNLECKQNLAKEAYFVCDTPGTPASVKGRPCTDEKLLSEVDSSDLVRKRESLRTEAKRNPKSRDFYIAHGASLPDLGNGLGPVPSLPMKALLIDRIKKMGLQLDCLSGAGKAEVLCSAVGHIFDPNLMVAGLIGGAVGRTLLTGAADLGTFRPLAEAVSETESGSNLVAPARAAVSEKSNFAKLQEIIDAQPRSEGGYVPLPHELLPIEGTDAYRLKIGYLSREKDKNFLKLLMVAVRDGKITEVDAGNVVGPKVVAMLEKMRSIKVRSGNGVRIFGNIEGKKVAEAQKIQIAHSANQMATGDEKKIAFLKRGSMYWTPEDITDFSAGVKNLKWLEACKEIYGAASLETCGPLSFEVNSARPDEVNWHKPNGD